MSQLVRRVSQRLDTLEKSDRKETNKTKISKKIIKIKYSKQK